MVVSPRLRAFAAVAVTLGAGGELAVRVAMPGLAPVWNAARVPLLTAVGLAATQVPWRRRTRPLSTTRRPMRSELSRHLARRMRD